MAPQSAQGAQSPAVVLTIAGSDNSSGAGIQADLKTITALDGYALTAVTCVVAEVPGKVSAIQAVRIDVIAEQIRLAFAAFPVAAVKTGMLYSTGIIRAVVSALLESTARAKVKPALVVDPVMVASSGAPLLKPDGVAAYRKLLLPLATLVTPNLDELSILANRKIQCHAEMIEAGRGLAEEFGTAFLLKGGHLKGKLALDVLVAPGGLMEEFSAPFVKGADPHGTGCTYSAAIATGLANGLSIRESVGQGKAFITAAIRQRYRWKKTEVLNHQARLTASP